MPTPILRNPYASQVKPHQKQHPVYTLYKPFYIKKNVAQMIQINPRIQPLKFLGSGPGSKIPCWSQSLRAVTFAAHFATPSGYYFFECPARRTPLKWLKNFRRSLCRSTKRNRKALWPFQKQACASVPGGVLVGQGMGSIPSYTIYEPVFGCLKRV